MKKFSTIGECWKYIEEYELLAIPMAQYSEEDGELLYWYVHHFD